MSRLVCHKCGWWQDDFWDENYNPITFPEKAWKSDLLYGNLDQEFWDEERGYMSLREVIAQTLEGCAVRIRGMVFRQLADLEGLDPSEVICPGCGLKGLSLY